MTFVPPPAILPSPFPPFCVVGLLPPHCTPRHSCVPNVQLETFLLPATVGPAGSDGNESCAARSGGGGNGGGDRIVNGGMCWIPVGLFVFCFVPNRSWTQPVQDPTATSLCLCVAILPSTLCVPMYKACRLCLFEFIAHFLYVSAPDSKRPYLTTLRPLADLLLPGSYLLSCVARLLFAG